MEVFGYSERGIVNSILYDNNAIRILNLIFEKMKFADSEKERPLLDNTTKIFVEQSLSDYGEADAIVTNNDWIIFIEAKVNAHQGWSILKEMKAFSLQLLQNDGVKKNNSNLIIQLYFKQALMNMLGKLDLKKMDFEEINQALVKADFIAALTKKSTNGTVCKSGRSLGDNPIVRKFVKENLSINKKKLYLALVPQSKEKGNWKTTTNQLADNFTSKKLDDLFKSESLKNYLEMIKKSSKKQQVKDMTEEAVEKIELSAGQIEGCGWNTKEWAYYTWDQLYEEIPKVKFEENKISPVVKFIEVLKYNSPNQIIFNGDYKKIKEKGDK